MLIHVPLDKKPPGRLKATRRNTETPKQRNSETACGSVRVLQQQHARPFGVHAQNGRMVGMSIGSLFDYQDNLGRLEIGFTRDELARQVADVGRSHGGA